MNNHMCSWITLNREAISKLLVSIRKHRLLLIDRRTSEDSIDLEIFGVIGLFQHISGWKL